MKYLLSVISLLVFSFGMALSVAPTHVSADMKGDMLVGWGKFSAEENVDVSIQDNFLKTIQSYLLGAYVVVAIGSMVFIGYRLFTAKGDPEEFKKAWIALVYIVIGLTIAPLAYVAVRIVSGFSF